MHYQFLHVTNQELLDKVYRFRYKVYCEESNALDPNNYPDKKEMDEYDKYSDQFAILDTDGEVCCTMRLIHHSPIGYPTANYLDFDKEVYNYHKDKICEMSRIFVAQKYRNMKDTKIFINSIVKSLTYPKIKEYGIEYCYGALESSFLKLVNMFKIPYYPLADAQLNYGKKRHPSILYIKALEFHNPSLIKQWNRLKMIRSLRICRRKDRIRRILGLKTHINNQNPNFLIHQPTQSGIAPYNNLT